MIQLRGSSAMKSGNAPALIRSMIAQMPHGRVAESGGGIGRLGRDGDQLDARMGQKITYRIQLVRLFVIDVANAGVDQHLEAMDAWRVRDVDTGVANRYAIARRLRDRVDLGVDRAIAILLEITVGRA